MTLSVKNLSGGYGQTKILNDVSFEVPNGSAVALIGLNGSGKTTIINHLINFLKPSQGQIVLNDANSINDAQAYQEQIAYIPEVPIIYEDLTLQEHLEVVMKAYNLPDQNWQEALRLLEIFRLEDKLSWFPVDFSKGMKQKVMIVSALMTNAKLLIVDEPFIGLDPLAVENLVTEIKNKKAKGVSVLLSTHVTNSAEKFVDQFVLIDRGSIKTTGKVKEILKFADAKTIDDLYLKLAKGALN
jgi:ABC-2 type transport system ATP-binding protein